MMCKDYMYGTCTSLDISSMLTDSLFWNQVLSKLLAAKDPKAINLPPSVMSVLAWKFVLKMKIPEIFQEWQMSIIQINVRIKLRHIPSIYVHSFKISFKTEFKFWMCSKYYLMSALRLLPVNKLHMLSRWLKTPINRYESPFTNSIYILHSKFKSASSRQPRYYQNVSSQSLFESIAWKMSSKFGIRGKKWFLFKLILPSHSQHQCDTFPSNHHENKKWER